MIARYQNKEINPIDSKNNGFRRSSVVITRLYLSDNLFGLPNVIFRSELHECQKTTSQKHLGEVAVNLRNFRTNYKKISLAIKLNIKKVLIILEIFFLKKSPIVNLLVMVRMLSKHQGSHARAY